MATRGREAGHGRAVPKGRLSRMARLGGLAASMAGSAAAGQLSARVRGERREFSDYLLTPANAARLADELSRLRGAALKVGQLISMDAGEFLPPELADVLSRVRAGADPMPPRQLKRVLAAAWGDDWLSRFSRFTARPVAAASIGQVHKGVTKDGRTLAVKVQYPGVRESIDSDIDNVGRLIRAAGLSPRGMDLQPLFQEAKRQLHEEADYEAELARMRRYAALPGLSERFNLPEPAADFSSRDVLAMSWLPGRAVEAAADEPQAVRDRIASEIIALTFEEIFTFGFVQSDPNFANYLFDAPSGRLGLIDFGAAREVPASVAQRYRALMTAGADRDLEAVREACESLGFIDNRTPEDRVARFVTLSAAALEPLGLDAGFDFGDSALARTLREGGMAFRGDRDLFPVPPVDVLYLQRKFGGVFLLASRLRARVNVGALFAPYRA